MSQSKTLKLLELYSGIGGMRYALEASEISCEIVAAVDINTVVNDVYRHNFGSANHMQRNIQSFTAEEFESLEADIVTMSPPCQPFTRVGLKLDCEDPRSKSFLHLLSIFCKMKKKPTYILLENVMGFENSSSRDALVDMLNECSYCYQEFLLSPLQFGVPNSRTRYYILAKLRPLKFVFHITNQVLYMVPNEVTTLVSKYPCMQCKKSNDSGEVKCIIKHFLESSPASYFDAFRIPTSTLSKHGFVLDIIEESSCTSCCFTKGYTHFLHGTGSVLYPPNSLKVKDAFEAVSNTNNITQKLTLLKSLNLRYFTPREIANIMCFPQNFGFPKHVTLKQQYRTLGNSINVFVVSNLFKLLVTEKF